MTDTLTPSQAVQLMRDEKVDLEQLEAMGFVVGTAQVAAAKAQPVVEAASEELLAALALVWEESTARAQTKTSPPRLKRTLGDKDGIAPYRVIITRAKS